MSVYIPAQTVYKQVAWQMAQSNDPDFDARCARATKIAGGMQQPGYANFFLVADLCHDIQFGSAQARQAATSHMGRVDPCWLAQVARASGTVDHSPAVLRVIGTQFQNPKAIVQRHFSDLQSPQGQVLALEIQAKSGDTVALSKLVDIAFKNNLPGDRSEAIKALGRLSHRASTTQLLEVLNNNSTGRDLRVAAAAEVLADWGVGAAIPYLRKLLLPTDSELPTNCYVIATALFRLGDKECAMNYLRGLVEDGDPSKNQIASYVIGQLSELNRGGIGTDME